MPRVDLVVESPTSASGRARQLESMFDVPHRKTSRVEWHGDVPYDEEPWSVGLIVGPSGSGKTQIGRQLFGEPVNFEWGAPSVIDDIAPGHTMDEVANVCQAVGFNTITAWLRPFAVLSNGEQFRASCARALLELPDPVVMDEFTSVVDRQVAAIAANAVQKYVRRNNRQFVAISCHYDVVDWLQPDWIFEPATMTYERREVQPRPRIEVDICRTSYSAWELFAPFHYLTRELNKSAQCFVLSCNGNPAAFSGVIHRPHERTRNLKGVSRTVTLPDWQGLGLAFVLNDTVSAAYKALGYRMRMYPAHPPYIRSFDRSPMWAMIQRPASFNTAVSKGSVYRRARKEVADLIMPGSRPNAVFEYVGPAMEDVAEAERLLAGVKPFAEPTAAPKRRKR